VVVEHFLLLSLYVRLYLTAWDLKWVATATNPIGRRWGPSMLIATCLILAIRTAKWPAQWHETESQIALDAEIEYAHRLASRVFSTLIAKHSTLFPSKRKAWYQPDGEDSPK
jgi:hypothetical protein